MKGRRNISEKVKNVIITLLLISAVFLGWESRLFGNASSSLSVFSNLIDNTSDSSDNGTQGVEIKTTGEARPLRVAVTSGEGAHYGAVYDMADVAGIYDKSIQLFGQALVLSQVPGEVEEQAWRAALESPGVYFEYMSSIPLTVLDGWFYDAELADGWSEFSARRLCLAAQSEKSILYFQDTSGRFYAAETELSVVKISELAAAYEANNAHFAFEIISTPLKDAYALLPAEMPVHPVLEVENPLTDATKIAILQKLGVSEHQKPITDETGNQDYIGDFTVKVSPAGIVKYISGSNPDEPAVPADESAAVELARRFAASTIGSHCGAAHVYFDTVRSTTAGTYVVTFTYVIAGGRIYLGQDGYAASVTIKEGVLIEAELRFRSYTISESVDKTDLIPELQAAAASGGDYILSYIDNGEKNIDPSWVYS